MTHDVEHDKLSSVSPEYRQAPLATLACLELIHVGPLGIHMELAFIMISFIHFWFGYNSRDLNLCKFMVVVD